MITNEIQEPTKYSSSFIPGATANSLACEYMQFLFAVPDEL